MLRVGSTVTTCVFFWPLLLHAQTEPASDPPPVEPPAATTQPAPTPETPVEKATKAWKLGPPKIYGYIQVHLRFAFATGTDGVVDNDNFRVQRVRLGMEGDLFPWLGYTVEIDPRAPDLQSVLRDAYLTLRVLPRHRIRIGQQKTQFGYENTESSTRLFAVNRTEVSDNLSRGVNLRDIGIGLLGNFKLGGGFRLEDAVTWVNGAGMNVQADDTSRKNFWGRLGLRYKNDTLGKLVARVGVSGGIGDFVDVGDPDDPVDDFRLSFKRLGFDVEVEHEWFFLSAEYVLGRDENQTSGETDEPFGYYVNLVGKTPWEVGPIVRYDVLGEEFKRWTFGVYYRLARDAFRFMVNYELRQVKDDLRGDDKLYFWMQAKF